MENCNNYQDVTNIPSTNEIRQMYSQDPKAAIDIIKEIKKYHNVEDMSKYWGYKNTTSVYNFYKKYSKLPLKKKEVENKPMAAKIKSTNDNTFELKFNISKEKGNIINEKILNMV